MIIAQLEIRNALLAELAGGTLLLGLIEFV